eukprot:1917848-Prorocentrum_lima.AAC.1
MHAGKSGLVSGQLCAFVRASFMLGTECARWWCVELAPLWKYVRCIGTRHGKGEGDECRFEVPFTKCSRWQRLMCLSEATRCGGRWNEMLLEGLHART